MGGASGETGATQALPALERSEGSAANGTGPAAGDDTLFPPPQSAAGRLLGHLVALQVPGTPIETTPAAIAAASRLALDAVSRHLARLAGEGLLLLEPAPESERVSVTVLLAPPLEEYGIQPRWAEPLAVPAGVPAADVPRPAAAAPPSPPAPAAAIGTGPGAQFEQREQRKQRDQRRQRTRRAQHERQSVTSDEMPEMGEMREMSETGEAPTGAPAADVAPRRSRARRLPSSAAKGRAAAAPPDGQTTATADGGVEGRPRPGGDDLPALTQPGQGEAPAPAAAEPQPLPIALPDAAPDAAPPAGPRRRPAAAASAATTGEPATPAEATGKRRARAPGTAGAAAGAAVDETAVLRGFVDRFERLLAEGEEWRRRAQQADERYAAAEKQLRAAERRAQAAEAKLATAQERLRALTDLIRRLQQLTRQADSAARGKAPRKQNASGYSAGQAGHQG